jgi:hypothetical protein
MIHTVTCSSVPMRLGKSLLQRSAIRTPTSNPDNGLKTFTQSKVWRVTEVKLAALVTNLFEDTFMHPGFCSSSAGGGWSALELNEGGE